MLNMKAYAFIDSELEFFSIKIDVFCNFFTPKMKAKAFIVSEKSPMLRRSHAGRPAVPRLAGRTNTPHYIDSNFNFFFHLTQKEMLKLA